MRFTALSAALALVFSVNAAAVNKRDVTAPVATCITDLNAVAAQLTVVTNGVSAYTASQGYNGALTVQNQETTLYNKLGTANTDCCAVSGPVSDEDANAVIAVVGPLTTQIEAVLQAIIDRKSEFDSVLLLTPIIKIDVNNLNTKTSAVSTCLVNNTPSDLASTAQGYADRITAAFTAAVTAYA